jgi:hypothetical protein
MYIVAAMMYIQARILAQEESADCADSIREIGAICGYGVAVRS